MSLFLFSNKAQEVARLLSEIPLDVWDKVVSEEPEAKLGDQLERYGFGKFATFMVAAGLNDYQLKGPAEKAYWPKLREILKANPVPGDLEDLYQLLIKFYENERFKTAKIDRLDKFLKSDLAKYLWDSTPKNIARRFNDIWCRLASTMGQKKETKTIVFAMKTLGISLILVGEHDFDFSKIPIPVDSRVSNITFKLLGYEPKDKSKDDEIRIFWGSVLLNIQKVNPQITMIHLDSLVWQIGKRDCDGIRAYFRRFSVPAIGEEFCKRLEGMNDGET